MVTNMENLDTNVDLDDPEIQEYSPQPKWNFKIFGWEIAKVPCARETILNGFKCGVGVGLLTFLFTSRAALARNAAVYSYIGVSFAYWTYCRYQYAVLRYNIAKVNKALDEQIRNYGKVDSDSPDDAEDYF